MNVPNKMLQGPKNPIPARINPTRLARLQARKERMMSRRQTGGIAMGTPGSMNVNKIYNTY